MNRSLALLAALLLALVGAAEAHPPSGADVKAALVRCPEVTYPAALIGCGDDPLTSGRIEITKLGDVAATLTGAASAVTYDVVLHALTTAGNGSTQLPIGVLATDAKGNATVRWTSVFDLGQAGVVALSLSRNGSTHFVAGFRGDRELHAGLVPCGAVNTPASLTGCGTDTLKSGSVKVDEGELKVELMGAPPHTTYAVVFRPLPAGPDVPLGDLTTDKKGKGSLKIEDLVPDLVVGAGNVVLRRDDLDQFVSGFQSTRKRPAHVARFHVGLLRCADVTTLAPLTDCGFDQLRKGDVIIDDKGDVNVHVVHAVPHTTYEVVFVGFDGTTEVSLGTLTTNPAGNGHVIVRDAFPVGTRGVGQVILKRDGLDQYVTGFSVSR